jgi:hypothetical protein
LFLNGLSYAEALASLPGLPAVVFDALDSNGDGQNSRPETGVVEGEGEGSCAGCSAGKSASGFDGLKRSLSNLFFGALSVTAILVFGGRRP